MSDEFDFEEAVSEENIAKTGLVYEDKFKGRPVLVMKKTPDDKYPFTIGLQKCKTVVENMQAIEAFIEKYDK